MGEEIWWVSRCEYCGEVDLTSCLTDSDILYFNVLGRSIIVLNSVKVAHDLLDKRGANYASRPRFVLFEVLEPHTPPTKYGLQC